MYVGILQTCRGQLQVSGCPSGRVDRPPSNRPCNGPPQKHQQNQQGHVQALITPCQYLQGTLQLARQRLTNSRKGHLCGLPAGQTKVINVYIDATHHQCFGLRLGLCSCLAPTCFRGSLGLLGFYRGIIQIEILPALLQLWDLGPPSAGQSFHGPCHQPCPGPYPCPSSCGPLPNWLPTFFSASKTETYCQTDLENKSHKQA